jgi:hypothetical protein
MKIKISLSFLYMVGFTISLLFVSELIVRIFIPQTRHMPPAVNEWIAPNLVRSFKESPWYIFTMKPNYDGFSHAEGFLYRYKTNSQGYRDDEISLGKDVIRILALGDSFTFGWGVDRPHTYPDVLESLLNRDDELKANFPGKRFDVINAGFHAGNYPPSYYLYLKHEGFALRPHFIIMQWISNDVGDFFATAWKDIDKKGLPRRIECQYEVIEDNLGNGYLATRKDHYSYRKFNTPILRKSHLFILACRWLEDFLPRILKFNDKYNEPGLGLDEIMRRLKKVFLATQDICDEKGVAFLLFYMPTDITADALPPHIKNEFQMMLSAGLRKDNFINLMESFLPLPDRRQLFFINDGHSNILGYRFMGEQLFYKIKIELLKRKNDLLRLYE